ncbi:MAG: isopenicillin N synthase family oxygenase [Alphaproteobacteria bacterium]|nr:isopenicillin N synthase family oxygenase [Alphaproteobacteria bacterium]
MNDTSVADVGAAIDAREDEIPGLDLGPYLRGEPGALDALAAKLRQVCENIGFFYIENHGLPQEKIDRAFAASARFHALPLEEKMKLKLDMNNCGYMPVNASMQRHSKVEKARKPNYNASFFVKRDRAPDDPDVIANRPFRGLNQWPADLPGFREDVMAYAYAAEQLGMRLLPVVARALDLPADYFAPFFNPAQFSLRMLHYPPRDESVPDQYGTGAHTDGGFLTLLVQNGVGGLQIRRTDGVWIKAPVLPGRYLVNSGDMMKRWTNDRFLSTPHRVMNTSGTERYSMAYFFDPHLDRVLECLPTCQGPGNPPKYAPITYGEYLTEFLNANYFHRGKASPDSPPLMA